MEDKTNTNVNIDDKNEKTIEEIKDNEININIEETVEKDDFYELKEDKDKSKGDYKSLLSPFLKILITFIITLIIVKYVSSFTNNKIIEDNLTGLWGDELGNYYEIYDKNFSMNVGNPDLRFFEGKITDIVVMESGYKIFVEGKRFNIINNNDRVFDKNMNLIVEIKEYTSELKVPMVVNLGTDDYQIIRLEDSRE